MSSETDSNHTSDGDDEGSLSSQSSPGRSSSDNNFSEDEGEDEDHSLGLSSGPGRISSGSDNGYYSDDLREDDDSSDSDEDNPSDHQSSSDNDSDGGAFSDEEDEGVFGATPWSRTLYQNSLRQIKHQCPFNFHLDLRYETSLTLAMWRRIGLFLGKNDKIKWLNLDCCSLTTDDIRELVNGGFKDNESIQDLTLADNPDIGRNDDMFALSCFLTNKINSHGSRFLDLNLSQVSFNADGLTILFSALDGNQIIRKLNLSNNDFSSETEVGKTFESSLSTSRMPRLTSLCLDGCQLSKGGSEAIAKFLENRSHLDGAQPPNLLHELSLNNNNLDDECTYTLAQTLRRHHVVENLKAYSNAVLSITCKYFEDILCDIRTIDSVYSSNHVLKQATFGYTTFDLGILLSINRKSQSPEEAAVKKISLFYMKDTNNFGIRHFDETTVEVMPIVLHWMHSKRGLPALYYYMRHWKVPTLYSFPSAERLRLGEKIDALKGENEVLVSENSALKLENGLLCDENAALKEIIEKQRAQLAKLQHSRSDTTEKSNDMLSPSSKKMKI